MTVETGLWPASIRWDGRPALIEGWELYEGKHGAFMVVRAEGSNTFASDREAAAFVLRQACHGGITYHQAALAIVAGATLMAYR